MMLMVRAAKASYTLHDNDVVTDQSGPNTSYVLRVRDMATPDKPREKLLSVGPGHLSVAELVAIVWGVGTRKEDVLAMAKRACSEYGEKALSHESNPTKLADTLAIPLGKAMQIVASFELGRRYHAQAGGKPVFIRNASDAYQYLHNMAHGQKEQLRGLYLNSRYQLIHDEVVSIGTVTSSVIHPREVFEPAITHGAVAIILAHNHPSGSASPTPADTAITAQLQHAGALLGIDLLDHLILTSKTWATIKKETPNE